MRGLWQLNHALERVSRRMEVSLGVTAPQRMFIRCIGKYPGLTASQLAAQFHLDLGTVSAALTRLELKGLVRRRRSFRDRRRVALGLTEKGRTIDGTAVGTVEHAVDLLLDQSSAIDIGRASSMLEKLTTLLEQEASLS
jgi:MarR family transcriptional regulator, organic hydroperoxide resistance regulator